MARWLDRLTFTQIPVAMPRLLSLLCLLAVTQPASAAETAPDLTAALAAPAGHERYRVALAALRGADNPALSASHADPQVAAAAIDAARERLVDAAPPNEAIAGALLAFAGAPGSRPDLAARAVHAVAESRDAFGGRISGQVARLALNPACTVRLDAIAALGDLGDGSQAATLARLAGDADGAVAEAAREGLASIQGKGVTDTFVRGIRDDTLGDQARIALLQAATRRGMAAATPPAAQALTSPALRLEAQKAVLKLARREHVADLRAAREKLSDAPATQAALDRLIARLEKEKA